MNTLLRAMVALSLALVPVCWGEPNEQRISSGEELLNQVRSDFGAEARIFDQVHDFVFQRPNPNLTRADFFSVYRDCLKAALQTPEAGANFLQNSMPLVLSFSPTPDEIFQMWKVLEVRTKEGSPTFIAFLELYETEMGESLRSQVAFVRELVGTYSHQIDGNDLFYRLLIRLPGPTDKSQQAQSMRGVYPEFLQLLKGLHPEAAWAFIRETGEKYRALRPSAAEILSASEKLRREFPEVWEREDRTTTQKFHPSESTLTLLFLHWHLSHPELGLEGREKPDLRAFQDFASAAKKAISRVAEEIVAYFPPLPLKSMFEKGPVRSGHDSVCLAFERAWKELMDPDFYPSRLLGFFPPPGEETPEQIRELVALLRTWEASRPLHAAELGKRLSLAPHQETFSTLFNRLVTVGESQTAGQIAQSRAGDLDQWTSSESDLSGWLGRREMNPEVLFQLSHPKAIAALFSKALEHKGWTLVSMRDYVRRLGDHFLTVNVGELDAPTIVTFLAALQDRPVPEVRQELERQASLQVLALQDGKPAAESFFQLVRFKIARYPEERFDEAKSRAQIVKELENGVAAAGSLAFSLTPEEGSSIVLARLFAMAVEAGDPKLAQRSLSLVHETHDPQAHQVAAQALGGLSRKMQAPFLAMVERWHSDDDELAPTWLAERLAAEAPAGGWLSRFAGCIARLRGDPNSAGPSPEPFAAEPRTARPQ